MGVNAQENAARALGRYAGQEAGAIETLARETDRLGAETKGLGRETQHLGSETASVGTAQGRALESVGRSAGSAIEVAGSAAIQYLDHRQISQGTAAWTRLTEQETKRWDETVKNSNPNDPTVAGKFMESLEDQLQKFQNDGFYTEGGKKWAEAHVNALRQHMSDKTRADMASVAGHAAIVNQQQSINSLSATVHSDPSSLDFSLAALKSSTEGLIASSPNITGEAAARLRSEILQKGAESIVKSAAIGYIEKTSKVPPWATDPKYSPYINGAELKQFEQAAKGYQRLSDAESRAARVQRDYENKSDFNAKVNDLEVSTLPKTAGEKPVLPADYWSKLRELGKHPGAALEPGRLKTMVDNGEKLTERLNKPEPLGPLSHDTTVDLLNRMRATDGTRLQSNDEIYKAYGAGDLNNADFKFLMNEFKEMRTPEGEKLTARTDDLIKAVGPQIDKSNPLMGKIDPSGKEGVYRFTVDLKNKIDEYRKTGKNPYDLLDPSKPDYMGRPDALGPYQKPLQQSIQDASRRLRPSVNLTAPGTTITGVDVTNLPPVKPRQQGESPADYLKRLGLK